MNLVVITMLVQVFGHSTVSLWHEIQKPYNSDKIVKKSILQQLQLTEAFPGKQWRKRKASQLYMIVKMKMAKK